MKVDLQIGEEKFDRNVSEDLSVDPNDFNDALCKQASLYAYYATKMQQVAAAKDQAQFDLDKTINAQIGIARAEFSSGGTRITDKAITAFVESQESVQAKRQHLINISHAYSQLYALVRALEHKRESLVNLAFMYKREFDAMASRSIKRNAPPTSGVEE